MIASNGKPKTSPLINTDGTDRNGDAKYTGRGATVPHAHGPRQLYANPGRLGMGGYKCF
jgi:hypothetical protein